MFHVLARTSRKMGATAWSGSFLVRLHRAKHAHKHTQSYTMIRLSFSKMRWGFGTLASHDCISDGYCLYIVVIGFVTRNITIVIC